MQCCFTHMISGLGGITMLSWVETNWKHGRFLRCCAHFCFWFFYSRLFPTSLKEISQPFSPSTQHSWVSSTSFFTPLPPDWFPRLSYEINYKLNKLIIWEFYNQYFPLLQTQISLIFQLINDEKRFKAIKVYRKQI